MGDMAERLWDADSDGRSRSDRRGYGHAFDNYSNLEGFEQMPPGIKAAMKQIANSLKTRVAHLAKVQQRLKNLGNELGQLEAGNLPPGNKPFRLPFATAETEEELSKEDITLHSLFQQDLPTLMLASNCITSISRPRSSLTKTLARSRSVT